MAIFQKVRMGLFHDSDIDIYTRDYLATVPEPIALRSIEEFCRKDIKTLKNPSAFLKGIVRKILEVENTIGGRGYH